MELQKAPWGEAQKKHEAAEGWGGGGEWVGEDRKLTGMPFWKYPRLPTNE